MQARGQVLDETPAAAELPFLIPDLNFIANVA